MPTPLTPDAKMDRLIQIRDRLYNLDAEKREAIRRVALSLFHEDRLYKEWDGAILTTEDLAEYYWADPIGHESEQYVYHPIPPTHPDWTLLCYETAYYRMI